MIIRTMQSATSCVSPFKLFYICLKITNCSFNTVHNADGWRQEITSTVKTLLKKADVTSSTFETDHLGRIIVYTDGCCLNNNQVNNRRAGIGVYWGGNHALNLSLPVYDELLTSNRAEILAAHAAIITAKEIECKQLCLCTDSAYVVNGCTEWLYRWFANDWRRKAGAQVKNTDLWKPLRGDLMCVFTTFIKKTDDSAGVRQAHALANEGAAASCWETQLCDARLLKKINSNDRLGMFTVLAVCCVA